MTQAEAHDLARDFLNLPYHEKLNIMRNLGILDTHPDAVISHSIWRVCVQRLREMGRIEQLRAAVDAAHNGRLK